MSKFTKKLAENIVSFIEEDTYSITEICNHMKISRKTYYEWKDTKPEFRDAIEKAEERRDDKLQLIARRSLKKKLEGYTLTEIRTTYVPDKDDPEKLVLKSKVVKEKEYAPDAHAIRLVLSKKDLKHTAAEQKKETPLNIVVNNPEAAEGLIRLRENLRSSSQEKNRKEAAARDGKRKSMDDYVLVEKFDLSPGRLYQKVKRREVRQGEKIREES